MLLSSMVLSCTLAIANLQRISMPKEEGLRGGEASEGQSQKCNEYLINDNFVRTTVVRGNSSQLDYCINQEDDTHKTIDLDQVVGLYKTFKFTNTYDHFTPNSPITQSGVLSINDHQEIPLFLKADIRNEHISINAEAVLGHDADEQMVLMDQLPTDARECLLPCSLGGPRGSNVVPMARTVHHLPAQETDSHGLGPPLSSWKSNEEWILRFLQLYPNGRVAWTVAVQYAEGVVADPVRRRAYRPVGFSRQFYAFKDHADDYSVIYRSPQTTFLNNNDDPCGRYLRNHILRMPSECKIPRTHSILWRKADQNIDYN